MLNLNKTYKNIKEQLITKQINNKNKIIKTIENVLGRGALTHDSQDKWINNLSNILKY